MANSKVLFISLTVVILPCETAFKRVAIIRKKYSINLDELLFDEREKNLNSLASKQNQNEIG